MVTITKPRRRQWEGGEGKAAALKDTRKLVAGVEKEWACTFALNLKLYVKVFVKPTQLPLNALSGLQELSFRHGKIL